MANERCPRQEQLLSEEEINNRIIEENNFHNLQMVSGLASGTVTDAVDGSFVPGITYQQNQSTRSPVPPPRYQIGHGTRGPDAHVNYSRIMQALNRTLPNITLENSSESNTLNVSLRRRLTPLETTARNSQLSLEERVSYFREKRATYVQEYLSPVDPSLNARLNLCAELMNLDLDFDRKYIELDLPRVLVANKEKSRFLHLTQGLGILEKYASNLIKENRPPYWRTVKFTGSLVQVHVGRVIGSRDMLKQMGYTHDIVDGVAFPPDVTEPDVNRLKDLAADLFFARYEIDALLVNRHPFYEIVPPIPQEEVELPQLFTADFQFMRPQPFPSLTSASLAPLSPHQTVISPSTVSSLSAGRLPVTSSPSNPTSSPSTPLAKSPSQTQGRCQSSASACFPPQPTRRQDKEPMDPAEGKGNGDKTVLVLKNETQLQPQLQMESEDDSEYEDAEDGMSAGPPHTSSDNVECRICGEQTATEFCNECKDTFCESCYVTYHRHPSRKHHIRRTLMAPPRTPGAIAPAACTAGTVGAATLRSKVIPSKATSGTSVTGDKPRVRKPPVPAPRRNITVKSPPLSQVTVKDGKSTESKAERTAPSLPPRLRHGLVQGQKASQEAISRQPSTVSPGQETILSPTSPPRPLPAKLAVTTALLGTGAMQCLGQQSVTTTMAKNLVPKGREIRRPPPLITHSSTTERQDQKDNEKLKTTRKAPPPIPPKSQPRSPEMKKAVDYQAVASPEKDRAILCHNCYCLNSSDAKTCVACRTTLTVKANPQPLVQKLSPQEEASWRPPPQHPDVDTFPPRNQTTAAGQAQLWLGQPPTGGSSGTMQEDVPRMSRPGYQIYRPSGIPIEQVQTALDPAKHWQCEVCTFINPAIRRVCEVCCKTRNVSHLTDVAHPRGDERGQQLASETQVETQAPPLHNAGTSPQHPPHHHHPHPLLTRSTSDGPPTTGAQHSMYPPLKTSFAGEAAQTAVPIGPPSIPSTQFQQTQASWFSTPVGNSTSNVGAILSPIVDTPVEEKIQREQEEIFVNGQCYVEWLKKGELEGFSPEEVNIASVLGCEDPEGPIHWLQTAWYDLMHTVMTQLAVPENCQEIGNVSPVEVREALIECTGNVSQAVKKCTDMRKEKVKKLQDYGVFSKTDCLTALDNTGNFENALFELEKMSLEPMLQRLLDSCLPDSTTEEQVLKVLTRQLNTQTPEDIEIFKSVVSDKEQDIDRRIRAILAEKELQSWGRAKTAIKLIDMNYSIDDSVDAASSCGDLHRALRFLQQECPVCYVDYPMTKMFTFLYCQDRVCQDCVSRFVTLTIKDKNIMNLVCPICGLPDNLDHDEAVALEYFNNLDIVLRGLVKDDIHDLFQRKIRDRTLMKEPNFRWCSHCSSGFINEQPGLKMMCPHCNHFTCFNCKRQWEEQHEGVTCEQFLAWKEANDPEFQAAGLAAHLRKNGIECPNCKFRYDLAKGGCMHFKCAQCAHEFCSGCYNRFSHGTRCGKSENCAHKGLHAHHPRDCYFYLRDRQPEELQELLHSHHVEYNTDPPEAQAVAAAVNDHELGEDLQGADVAVAAHCKMVEQKQTSNGLVDEECGENVPDGYAGLCIIHYVEYLVVLVNDNLIDPADIMSSEDLKIVLRREELEPPEEAIGMTNDQYRMLLLNTVKQQLPLPKKPPRKRILADENELQPPEEHDDDHNDVDNVLWGFNNDGGEEIVLDEVDSDEDDSDGDDSDGDDIGGDDFGWDDFGD